MGSSAHSRPLFQLMSGRMVTGSKHQYQTPLIGGLCGVLENHDLRRSYETERQTA